MLRSRIPFSQVVFATLLGVCGGVYIYTPFFVPEQKTSGQEIHDTQKTQSESDNSSSTSLQGRS
ncbi:protein PIGBOS1 [Antennarius striatus]|uniref:protein PIGBOS1 n=1 Tax=Antennarius striatus TaxID=241820 RepID=UPI0035B35AB2